MVFICWQKYKKRVVPSSPLLTDIVIGMVLGAGVGPFFKKSKNSGIKFIQRFKQKDFVFLRVVYYIFLIYISDWPKEEKWVFFFLQ